MKLYKWLITLLALALPFPLFFSRMGITSVIDPGIPPDDFHAYQEVWKQKKLTVRVAAMLRFPTTEPKRFTQMIRAWGPTSGFGDSLLRVGGIKLGVDGGNEAFLHRHDYPNRPGYRGMQIIPTADFKELSRTALAQGWQVGVHAVGGGAMDIVLDAWEDLDREFPLKGR